MLVMAHLPGHGARQALSASGVAGHNAGMSEPTGFDEEFSSPEWGPAVVNALRKLLTNGRYQRYQHINLVSVELERDGNGVAFLRAVYDDSNHERRIGVRRQLDGRGPLALVPGVTPAESLARDIADGDIDEPLGSYWYLLAEDSNGVWWWGDGYTINTP